MDDGINLNAFNSLSFNDRQAILVDIMNQLEKDTGFCYSDATINAENPVFLETMRKNLAQYVQKIASNNQTRFMHLIYRVDISQAKMNKIPKDDFYYHHLSEMILSRLFQKIITRRHFKS